MPTKLQPLNYKNKTSSQEGIYSNQTPNNGENSQIQSKDQQIYQPSEGQDSAIYQHQFQGQGQDHHAENQTNIKQNVDSIVRTKEQMILQAFNCCGKSLKIIFKLFCQETEMKNVKHPLFDQKNVRTEMMNLNKWKIFCKEFQIVQQIISNQELLSGKWDQNKLKVKDIKFHKRQNQKDRISKLLSLYFKKASQGYSEIGFQEFIKLISMVYQTWFQQEKQVEKSLKLFIQKILGCSDEKTVREKLKNIKLKTPQYNFKDKEQQENIKFKVDLSSHGGRFSDQIMNELNILKSIKKQQKQNRILPIDKETRFKETLQKSLTKSRYNLNTIIKQAKLTLMNSKKQNSKSYTQMAIASSRINLQENKKYNAFQCQNSEKDKQITVVSAPPKRGFLKDLKKIEKIEDKILNIHFKNQKLLKLQQSMKFQ